MIIRGRKPYMVRFQLNHVMYFYLDPLFSDNQKSLFWCSFKKEIGKKTGDKQHQKIQETIIRLWIKFSIDLKQN